MNVLLGSKLVAYNLEVWLLLVGLLDGHARLEPVFCKIETMRLDSQVYLFEF